MIEGRFFFTIKSREAYFLSRSGSRARMFSIEDQQEGLDEDAWRELGLCFFSFLVRNLYPLFENQIILCYFIQTVAHFSLTTMLTVRYNSPTCGARCCTLHVLTLRWASLERVLSLDLRCHSVKYERCYSLFPYGLGEPSMQSRDLSPLWIYGYPS